MKIAFTFSKNIIFLDFFLKDIGLRLEFLIDVRI